MSGSGIDDNILLPHELTGREAINEGFTFTLTCLSSDAFLELKTFIGVPIQLAVLTDNGDHRAICGIVTHAEHAGSDGGFSRYVLTLQDPFAVLALRINSRVFQDLSVRQFTSVLLQEHRQNNAVLAACFALDDRCISQHPSQPWVTQYNESDAGFLSRWLAQEGIAWYFEHGESAHPGEQPKLTLVLFDDVSMLDAASAGKARFHRSDATEDEDAITEWRAMRALQPGGTMRASYEYKNDVTNTQYDQASNDQGHFGTILAGTLEDYRYDSHHSADGDDDYARYGKLRIGAHDYAGKLFSGTGTHRELVTGRHFELSDHPVHDQDAQEDRQFTVIRQNLYARNNLPDDMREVRTFFALPDDTLIPQEKTPATQSVYRTRFDAVRKHISIIPAFSNTELAKPVAPSLMTATVVGPPGEEIHTDALGRIKVRMPFTRIQDQRHAEGAGATGSDRDSVWIRVAQRWNGKEYGHVWIPRIGDEVLINFIQDDIDRPIVTASVYNGTHRPATFSDAGNLPGNKTLSGIKSKMVKGSGHNEIVWDDSTAEQRIRVATDHANSALNQGFLVHPRVGGKGEPRGEGFELRSDDYGAIRAGKGLLVSTDVRENARSTHMDSKELTTQLKGALELSTVLSDAAKDHHADLLEVNEEAQRLLQVAEKTYSQSGGTGQKAEVAGYEEPVMAFSSPAGILSATPKTQQITAGENIHISSQKDTNIAIGKRLAMAIKESWSVFVATSGIKLFAGKGKVQIQAQDENVEITARQEVNIASIAGDIDFAAARRIRITAGGGCQIEIANGQIAFRAPGPVNIHGSVKNFTEPARVTPQLPELPSHDTPHTRKFALASLEGKLIDGAEVSLFDPETKTKVWSSPIAATGFSDPMPDQPNSDSYTAVIGLKGSIFHFYDIDHNPQEDEDDDLFEDEHPSRRGE